MTAPEQKTGTKYLLWHSFFNGLGFNFIGDTTVVLLALYYGASNTTLGYLSSALNVSGLVLLFVPLLFAGMNLMTVYFWSWIMRGLICCFYGLVIFLRPDSAIGLICIVYMLFCIFRTIGVAMLQPVQRILSTEESAGIIVADMAIRASWSSIIARIISALILGIKFLSGLPGLLILQALGIIANTAAAWQIKKIPLTVKIEPRNESSGIIAMLRASMADRERAIALLLNWGALCLGILAGFTIPFLRKSAHFSISMIFSFTIVGTLAGIAANAAVRPFVDKIGSKLILTAGHFLIAACSLAWCFVSPFTNWTWLMGLGLVTSFCMALVGLLVGRIFINSFPDNERLAYSSMASFVSALIALIMGIIGGKLADGGALLCRHFPTAPLHEYSITFVGLCVVAIINGILCFGIQESRTLTFKELAGILRKSYLERGE
ncbi:MAG: hypothetical protein PHC61_01980 [Chitinivibrionales bacterium]|nr:hypothetical protein [Chitinivibrionales bacterium]